MADNDLDLEKESSTGMERVMFVLIPIVFTAVLVAVLLTLFNMDFRDGLLKVANKIPYVNNWVPDPKLTPEEQKAADAKAQTESSDATIKQLKTELTEQTAQLEQATTAKAEQDKKVQELEQKISSIEEQQTAQAEQQKDSSATNEDPYLKQVKSLSSMYEDMRPSKSAPILQNMTNEEVVQLLSFMRPENQVRILEKMDPQLAADITQELKNATNSSDLSVAALQSRIKKEAATPSSTSSTNLDTTQLGATFSSMNADTGAKLILETNKISPDKALNILSSVDAATRSKLLEAMNKENPASTTKILNKLLGSN